MNRKMTRLAFGGEVRRPRRQRIDARTPAGARRPRTARRGCPARAASRNRPIAARSSSRRDQLERFGVRHGAILRRPVRINPRRGTRCWRTASAPGWPRPAGARASGGRRRRRARRGSRPGSRPPRRCSVVRGGPAEGQAVGQVDARRRRRPRRASSRPASRSACAWTKRVVQEEQGLRRHGRHVPRRPVLAFGSAPSKRARNGCRRIRWVIR